MYCRYGINASSWGSNAGVKGGVNLLGVKCCGKTRRVFVVFLGVILLNNLPPILKFHKIQKSNIIFVHLYLI